MFNLFSTSNLFFIFGKLIKFIESIFFALLISGLTLALFLSPLDYIQGDSVRIMYIHVPSAWISLMCFTTISLMSFFHLVFKIKKFYPFTKSIAPIGLLFTCMAVATGSVWGKPTWGSWWVWDARLTSMIVLMFFYIAYIFVFKLVSDDSKSNKISSYIALIGAINIPIIKYSVDWFNTLHQPASIKIGSSSIHPSMLIPLLLMLLVFLAYCALIFLMKYRIEIIKIKAKNINRL